MAKKHAQLRFSWPKMEIECPDEIIVAMLKYWKEMFDPKHPEYLKPYHKEDIKSEKEVANAIDVLLKFYGYTKPKSKR